MRGGTPDRVPVAPFGMGRVDPDSDIGRELIARTDIILTPPVQGDMLLGASAGWASTVEGDSTTRVLQTPGGPLVMRDRSTGITHATVDFPLKSPEDVDRFLSLPYTPPDYDCTEYLAAEARLGEDGLAMAGIPNGVCLPASWFSPQDFCLMWAERPDLVRKLTQVAADRINTCVERLCRAGVRAFRIIGGEYVSVQLGPKAFAELITPFDTELVDIIHRHGGIAYYHNHGRVMDYLPALAALGIDALDPLEAPPWGDVDLREARRRAGDRLCFLGNLDDMEIIDALPEGDVLAIARERLEAAGPTAFILGGTASGTYGEKAARNFIAMAEMVESL